MRWGQPTSPLQQIAQLLRRHVDGILAYCHEKVPFGKVEAINGSIRAMLRRWTGLTEPHQPAATRGRGRDGLRPSEPEGGPVIDESYGGGFGGFVGWSSPLLFSGDR